MIDAMYKAHYIIAFLFFGLACNQSKQGPVAPPSPLIQKVLNHSDTTKTNAATEEAIQALAARFKKPLPDKLLELWRNSDGVTFKKFYGKLLGPAEIVKILDLKHLNLQEAGLLPLLYDNQSNYVMLCMSEPLAPRVMYTPHDDGPRLLYRDVEAFIKNLLIALDGAEDADSHYRELQGDYERTKPRTAADLATGKVLLAGPEDDTKWQLGMVLLDDSDLAPWQKLLESGQRDEARRQLAAMKSPAVANLLKQDQAVFEQFVTEFEKAARAAGLTVGERQGDVLNIGGHWIKLDALFSARKEPRALERMLNWCRDLLEEKDPRERPDYIFRKIKE
jgi:hypothetical protein